jgi:hypothetical protein
MKQCIDRDIPPRELAMNQSDIKAMYPKLNEDFRIISGDELQMAINAARQAREAGEQGKAWKAKKEDAENALAVLLKDVKILRGLVDDEIVDLAAWQDGMTATVQGKEVQGRDQIGRAIQAAGADGDVIEVAPCFPVTTVVT